MDTKPTTTSPECSEEVAPLRSALLSLLEASNALRTRHSTLPAEGSKAQRELAENSSFAGAWGDFPVQSAQQWVVALTIVAEDHVLSICDLLAMSRGVVFSNEVLARSALEALARATWLGEAIIDPRERVRRWQVERLNNLKEGEHLDSKKAVRERKAIALTSRCLGIPVSLSSRPSATKLVKRLYLDHDGQNGGHNLFRRQSATTHSTIYSIVSSLHPELTNGHMQQVRFVRTVDEINRVLIELIFGYSCAMKELVLLFGWRDPDWESTCRDALAEATSRDQQLG